MKIRLVPIHAALLGLAVLLSVRIAGQNPPAGGSDDPDDPAVYRVTIKKIKTAVDDLAVKLDEAKQKEAAAEQSLKTADPESRPRIEESFKAAANQRQELHAAIENTRKLVVLAQTPGHEAERRELLHEAEMQVGVGQMTAHSLEFHSDFLDDLKRRAEMSEEAAANPGKEAASTGAYGAFNRPNVFNTQEKGGGVFLDEPAAVPVDPAAVQWAEYDLSQGRFVLHLAGRSILLPATDPAATATITGCLYDPPPHNIAATSMNIDPATMGRLTTGIDDEVLFGCERLWNTEAGRILIDSDDLLSHIWMGKNRNGDLLTREFHYHSLAQTILDHPMMAALSSDAPRDKSEMDMRVWIRPEKVTLHTVGDELEFDPVSFHLFTETVHLANPKVFKGAAFPNPGADVFAQFFDENFSLFAPMTLRTDEHTGREIKPFEELPDLARIAAIVLWIRNSNIHMDASWAAQYPVPYALTRHILTRIRMHDVEKEIDPPIVIYNQFGPSRIIDSEGRIFLYKYDQDGHFVKMVRARKDEDGRIVEMPG